MTDIERQYERADRNVIHYLRLLAGSLSERERRHARLALIRAVFRRAELERALEGRKREMVEV